MTKVWLVIRADYEGCDHAGVFTDGATAEDVRDRLKAAMNDAWSYEIDEFELDQLPGWVANYLAKTSGSDDRSRAAVGFVRGGMPGTAHD